MLRLFFNVGGWWLTSVLLVMVSLQALAELKQDSQPCHGAFSCLFRVETEHSGFFSADAGHIGGWLNAGISINPDEPKNNYNGTLGFSDRANELQLNQLYLYVQRDLSSNPEQWSWGGRLDFVFGSDAFFTRSMGDPADHWDKHLLHQRIYGIAFPQAYLQAQVPIGSGLRLKLGEFYTLIGYESVMAPDNFFYSRSYTMQFGEPFSHTGVLASYSLTSDLELSAGTVTGSPFAGWDGSFQHRLENFGFVGAVNLKLPDRHASLALSATHGSVSDIHPQDVNLYSLVYKQDLAERWHLTLQHDYGWMPRTPQRQGAQWYGVVGYLNYDVGERLQLGLRLEWFRDDDGVRVGAPARYPEWAGKEAGYYAATFGARWNPTSWLVVRPSVRYDQSDQHAFQQGGSDRQWIISSDVLVTF